MPDTSQFGPLGVIATVLLLATGNSGLVTETKGNVLIDFDSARANKIYKKFLTAGDGPELLTTGSLDVAQAFLLEKDLD
jgi:hypothetical protein